MSRSIRHALERQSMDIERLAIEANSHLNNIHQIKAYLTNRVQQMQLTPHQQALLSLYEFIYNQLMSAYFTEDEVVELVIRKTKGSRAEALAYVRESKELFNSTIKISKIWELKRELHVNEVLRQRAVDLGDLKSAAAFSKIKANILATIEEEEDKESIFTGHTFEVTANPEILGITAPSKKDKRLLLEELKEKFGFDTEDIDIDE